MANAFAASPQIATFLSSSSSSSSSSSTFHTRPYSSYLSLATSTLPSLPPLSKKSILFHDPRQRKSRVEPIPAAATAEDAAVDATDQLVSNTTDDGVSTVVSALFFVAFIGLSVITLGVIYLGVTDFLQKREKEKFEKEEAAKNKKRKKKKKVVRARAGPRGFGQKIVENDDDD